LSHKLIFTPINKDLPFHIEVCTDTKSTILKEIDPLNFTPDDIFLSLYTTIVPTHIITLVDSTETMVFRIRNLIDGIPGSWTDLIILEQTPDDSLVPFLVDVIPAYTIFSLNLRYILTDSDGNVFGPYIPTTKYIPSGDYTLSVQDLAAKNYNDYQINTTTMSEKQIFIDTPIGYLIVNTNYTYYIISDFGDISLSDKLGNIKYELEVGKYYIIIKDNNKIISTHIVVIEENMETIL
jgi:hypothetical protein